MIGVRAVPAAPGSAWGEGVLHPAIAALLARARAAGIPALSAGTPAEARAVLALGRAGLGQGPVLETMRSVAVPTRAGSIPATLFAPSDPAGVCVYLHGGGWVVGSPADYETLARTLAARSGCAVLVPDYRLAPEHPFPAGLEDAEDAIVWAGATLVPEMGGRLVLAGDSAGGNLATAGATVAAALLRDRVTLAGQVLIYPVTDADFERDSYRRFGTGLPLQATDMAWFFGHYADRALWRDSRIAPLHAQDLSGLPPTVMLLAELDVLRDEGEAYAARLAAAGRLQAVHRYASVTHGFIRLHQLVDVADQAVGTLAAAVRAFAG